MKIVFIHYTKKFLSQLRKLPENVVALVIKKENIFRSNPLHPSLRLHSLQGNLHGLWSISISGTHRIIFEQSKTGDIIFHSIGTHDIYRKT